MFWAGVERGGTRRTFWVGGRINNKALLLYVQYENTYIRRTQWSVELLPAESALQVAVKHYVMRC